jgi:hypothetical protein
MAGNRTLIANYPGDSNFVESTVTTGHLVSANLRPTAVDDGATTPVNTPLVIDAPGVLGNDSDPDGGPSSLIAQSASDPDHGTVTMGADGSFTYTPDQDFTGIDTFTYEAFDGAGASTATVTVTVGP